MHIDHITIWTDQLVRIKDFYEKYFQAKPGGRYTNPITHFESYFLSFSSGSRLELMSKPVLSAEPATSNSTKIGYAHRSSAAGSDAGVDELSARLVQAGCTLLDGPRRTGDGYYECLQLDPVGNPIEITA